LEDAKRQHGSTTKTIHQNDDITTLVPQVPKESRDKVESPDPKEYPESQANLECPAHRETRDQLGHLAPNHPPFSM